MGKQRLGDFITQRDRLAIMLPYNYDGCGKVHIRKMVFGDVSEWVFERRWQFLLTHDYLDAVRMPTISGHAWGTYLVQPGRRGRQEVADMLGCRVSQLRPPRQITRAIPADHQQAICDFRVALATSCDYLGISLTQWINERELRGKFDRTPDGQFTLVVGELEQRFRLEVDRGTITDPRRMIERLKAYLDGDDRSPVLWVVPDAKRAAKLSEWCLTAANGDDATMFWITEAGCDPLSPVWQVVGGVSNARLTP